MVVSFTVYKSSKYLFDCIGTTDVDQSQQLYRTVDAPTLEALRLNAVDVVKRMDYAEVDKMIATCRQHPPQTVVVPATHGDSGPFREFTKYLKARQRAGVALLADGRLLILSPLEKEDLQLRCVVANAKPLADASGTASLSPARTTRVNDAARVQHSHTETRNQAIDALPLPPPCLKSAGHRQDRVGSRNRISAQQEKKSDMRQHEPCREQNQSSQAGVRAPTRTPDEGSAMLYDLPRLERATQIAQFRREYDAFHTLHYDVLQQWSKSNPDR
uniref:Spen paralogue and orthologue SPOC C-terminal domain-containing protein n=1 Tax=Peronospora matthiolae TaxID=2874970 RepID=A0AAV1TKE7_9STRA